MTYFLFLLSTCIHCFCYLLVSIIVSAGDHYASAILDYLFARTEKLGLDLQLGKEKNNNNNIKNLKHPGLQWIKGRLSISSRNSHSSVFGNFGLAGLIERCRFGFLPLDLAAKYGMNRIIERRTNEEQKRSASNSS